MIKRFTRNTPSKSIKSAQKELSVFAVF